MFELTDFTIRTPLFCMVRERHPGALDHIWWDGKERPGIALTAEDFALYPGVERRSLPGQIAITHQSGFPASGDFSPVEE